MAMSTLFVLMSKHLLDACARVYVCVHQVQLKEIINHSDFVFETGVELLVSHSH